MGLFGCTFGAMFVGYCHAGGYGNNFYTVGYRQAMVQPDDFSKSVMDGFAGNDQKKYLMQHSLLMHQALLERKGDLDVLEWLVIARHYAKNGEEETAF